MKTQDVTKFLTDMVEIAMYGVDDDGYITKPGGDVRVLIAENGFQSSSGRPILIYQEEIRDTEAYVLNPLAEGFGQTATALWFYKMLQASLHGRIHTLCDNIVRIAAADKLSAPKAGVKTEAALHIPMEILNIAAKISDDVDEKVIEEIKTLFSSEDGNGFLTIYYQKKNLRSVVRSGIFDPETMEGGFRSKFPKIRKKTWGILERLLLGILHIKSDDELEKFGRKADGLSCVRLSSLLNTLLALYQEINPLLGLIQNGEIAIDLSVFAGHILNLGAYADNARFFVQPQRTIPAPVGTAIPGAPAAIPGASSPFSSPANVSLVPGATYADGRQDPPSAVYSSTGMPGAPYPTNPYPMGPAPGYVPQALLPISQGYGQQSPPWGVPPMQGNFSTPPWNPPYGNQILPAGPNLQGISLIPGMPPGIYR